MLHYGNTDFGGMIGYLACIISGSVVAFVPQEENENDVCKKISGLQTRIYLDSTRKTFIFAKT